jgi:hypothetical protein
MAHISVTLIDGDTRQVHTISDIEELFRARQIDGVNAERALRIQIVGPLGTSDLDPAEVNARASQEFLALTNRVQQAGGFVGADTPPPPATGGAGDLPTVGEARLAQEGGPGAPGNIFRQFLSRQPFGALSQAGQDVLGQRFQPAFRSFQLFQGDPLAPENTFRNFLRQEGPFEGQNILDREGFASRLQQVAGMTGRPSFSMGEVPTPGGTGPGLNPLTLIEQTILDRLQNNQTALDVSLQPLLGGINPSFRRGVGTIGQRIFDRFQDINPGESFLKFLGQRGGRLFG